jgi:D-alanine transaminase
MRTVFVNGDYVNENEAKVSIFDRGFLFADGVYEVTSVINGKLIDFEGHFTRLQRSLKELDMEMSMDKSAMLAMHRELVSRNNTEEGMIYLQITRGVADREFTFPPKGTPATIVAFTQNKILINSPVPQKGIKVISVEDLRWGRCDIKTVQLLYPSLAKMEAKNKGVDDAWMVRDNMVTEGTSNNAYIVTKDNTIVTRDLSNQILHGITRKAVLACAEALQMKIEERPFSLEEIANAKEAFVTSATAFVMPVVEFDGTEVGNGKPGPVALKLREIYIAQSLKTAI